MNLGKLSKRLRKELLANPKQAVVLAIVCVIACWFWSPLLLKWFKGKGKSQIARSNPATETENTIAKAEPQRSWFDIYAWRQADPLTRSAPLQDETRDPFRLPKPVMAGHEEEEEEEQNDQPIAAPVHLEKLSLKLEAIIYSGSRRLAQINGLTVKENDEVPINGEDEAGEKASAKLVGRVVAIHPTEVVLEVGRQSLRLSLQPKLLGRGEVVKRLRTQ
jgi:hypothetical protein